MLPSRQLWLKRRRVLGGIRQVFPERRQLFLKRCQVFPKSRQLWRKRRLVSSEKGQVLARLERVGEKRNRFPARKVAFCPIGTVWGVNRTGNVRSVDDSGRTRSGQEEVRRGDAFQRVLVFHRLSVRFGPMSHRCRHVFRLRPGATADNFMRSKG